MQLVEFFTSFHSAWILVCILVGLLVGSFLNVVAYRLPKMLERDWQAQAREILELPQPQQQQVFNLVLPNSCCPNCQAPIRAWQNIPIISWLILRGRCSGCRQPISWRYPLVELASGLLSGVVAWQLGFGWPAVLLLVLTWSLLVLSLIDAEHQLLPDAIVLPVMWLGLLINSQSILTSLPDALFGAMAGYLSLWLVFWLFKLVTGKEGMGYGDFKLLAMLGAWGGWQILPLTIILSSMVGAVLGVIILRLQSKGLAQPLPFGPYLAIAGWIAILWGEQITNSYLQFAGF